jgi:L-ascorbate metabolism protein UlaG (beta-lactamase superfamily)
MTGLLPDTVHVSQGARRLEASDASLLAAADTQVPEGSAGVLWWLGQAGFALRHRDGLVLIDPYLSDSLAAKYAGTTFPHQRLHPAPATGRDLARADVVLHTHAHTDHLDGETVRDLEAAGSPQYVLPRARLDVALERGVPASRAHAVTSGSRLTLGHVDVQVVPAAHEELTVDEAGDHVFVGYVLTVDGVRIYHSGDCVPYRGQADLLRNLAVDVALLPVNGRDSRRLAHGVPGNFHLHEAVQLCRDAGIPELVCHHFGLFDFNTTPPSVLQRDLAAVTDVAWTVPRVGAAFSIRKEIA